MTKTNFLLLAVICISASALSQTNQIVWMNGRAVLGQSIDQIDSIKFGVMEDADQLVLWLPRTNIVHDTIYIERPNDTIYIEKPQTSFVQGQTIAISVSAGEYTSYASGRSMDIQEDNDVIHFTWEQSDSIRVLVGNQSSIFTLYSGAGTTQATFIGQMPADGNAYSVQFPIDEPLLSSQEYIPDKIPHNKMLFLSKQSTITTTTTITPQYAFLQLNCSGNNKSVKKIEVNFNEKNYTLNCGNVALGTNGQPFYLVIEPGTSKLSVKITATDNTVTEKSSTYNLTIEAGICLIMPNIPIASE